MAENKKQTFIIDASILIKWLLNEKEDLFKALKIIQDFMSQKIDLIVPTHCYYEILNTFGIKVPSKAITLYSQILMLQIPEQKLTLKNAFKALEIMRKISKVSFYDASYHATAIENNGTFITADEKYYRKAKSLKHIILLKNYPISPQ